MSQCTWTLYESGHKFLMKGSRILYTFALLNMGWEGQIAVSEHFEAFTRFHWSNNAHVKI